jgi:hypothetical protein
MLATLNGESLETAQQKQAFAGGVQRISNIGGLAVALARSRRCVNRRRRCVLFAAFYIFLATIMFFFLGFSLIGYVRPQRDLAAIMAVGGSIGLVSVHAVHGRAIPATGGRTHGSPFRRLCRWSPCR